MDENHRSGCGLKNDGDDGDNNDDDDDDGASMHGQGRLLTHLLLPTKHLVVHVWSSAVSLRDAGSDQQSERVISVEGGDVV